MNNSQVPASNTKATTLILWLGLLIATGFALAKFAVQNGTPVFAVFYWQLLGASVILLSVITLRGRRLSLRPRHVRYYVVGGLLGVSAPQLMAYAALQHIPTGLFTILLTLSPITTFIFASLYERALLPLHRLLGIVIGLIGVSMATLSGMAIEDTAVKWIAIALGAPLLLAVANIYRHKALPDDVEPVSLAAGTLLSQAVILSPLMLLNGEHYSINTTGFAVLALAGVTATSYILTFAMQRLTDGVGFSQVGYFITLGGVVIGAVFFNEPIGFSLVFSVALLFVGLGITNGHINVAQARLSK